MNGIICIPLPQARLEGEGRVRGRRTVLPMRCSRSNRIPLTPTLSPIAFAMGEREYFAEAA
jgi:hypothetical protein